MKKLLTLLLVALSLSASAQQSTAERYEESYKAFPSSDAIHVIKAPSIKPDGRLYHVYGAIEIADGEMRFIAKRYGKYYGFNQYYAVRIPARFKEKYLASAQINGPISIVGAYLSNAKISMTDGREVTIPQFDAVFIEF